MAMIEVLSLPSEEGVNYLAIKRVYYLFNTSKDVRRGFHAHKDA